MSLENPPGGQIFSLPVQTTSDCAKTVSDLSRKAIDLPAYKNAASTTQDVHSDETATARDVPTYAGARAAARDIALYDYAGTPTALTFPAPLPPPSVLIEPGMVSRNLPPQNPLFTGHEKELEHLHQALKTNKAAFIQGPSGMGKTQIALEYAHRYAKKYRGVFWVRGDNSELLASQIASLAPELLSLPEETPHAKQLEAVQGWFASHSDWLLIVDNAENTTETCRLLPSLAKRYLLVTTREPGIGGITQKVQLKGIEEEAGALFLLRRAEHLTYGQTLEAASPDWQEGAKAVSREVDGFPLALHQAGAYIKSAGIPPQEYLKLYHDFASKQTGEYESPAYKAVVVTSELVLQRASVGEQNPRSGSFWNWPFRKGSRSGVPNAIEAGNQLLMLCAFLAPAPLPVKVLNKGARALPEPLATLAADPQNSLPLLPALLQGQEEPSVLVMHPFVQEILRNRLSEVEQKEWRERVVRVLTRAYPEGGFSQGEQFLPHWRQAADYIEQGEMKFEPAAALLVHYGTYLMESEQYREAEPLLKKALVIYQSSLPEGHRHIATVLNNLASVYYGQGRYIEAESRYQKVLAMRQSSLPEGHPDITDIFHNLAMLYYKLERYEEAEQFFQQALSVCQASSPPKDTEVSHILWWMAEIRMRQLRYAEAESFYLQTLAILRSFLGEDHPRFANASLQYAALLRKMGRIEEAEALLQQYSPAAGSKK